MATPAQPATTQIFLDIHDIISDLLILKNGTVSLIISVDAMNFGLLAEEEQDGIIYAYAGLLNSLNYPIQIVIRSQTKDVSNYLTLLKNQEDLAPNQLMQQRIRTYREFVSNVIYERNVLDKKFFVVIPVDAVELGILPPQSVLPGSKPVDLTQVEKTMIIEKARAILDPRRDHIMAQFARIGLYSRQIETQEIIQLFYLSYNPEAAEGQEITDSVSYTTPMVRAGIQQEFVPAAASVPPVEPQPSSPPPQPTAPTQSTAPVQATTPTESATIPTQPPDSPTPTATVLPPQSQSAVLPPPQAPATSGAIYSNQTPLPPVAEIN